MPVLFQLCPDKLKGEACGTSWWVCPPSPCSMNLFDFCRQYCHCQDRWAYGSCCPFSITMPWVTLLMNEGWRRERKGHRIVGGTFDCGDISWMISGNSFLLSFIFFSKKRDFLLLHILSPFLSFISLNFIWSFQQKYTVPKEAATEPN